jgi:hypothetical protein
MGYTDGLVEKFGTDITVKSAASPAGRAARAIISPLDFPDYDAVSRPARPGAVGRAKYLLVAPSSAIADGEEAVKVECGAFQYELERAERVGSGAEFAHWEGILVLKGRVNADA